jgi:hypothetical protein
MQPSAVFGQANSSYSMAKLTEAFSRATMWQHGLAVVRHAQAVEVAAVQTQRPSVMRQVIRIPYVPRRVGSGSHLVVLADEPSPKMDSIRKMIPVKSDGEGLMMGEESRRRHHAACSSLWSQETRLPPAAPMFCISAPPSAAAEAASRQGIVQIPTSTNEVLNPSPSSSFSWGHVTAPFLVE